MIGNITINIKTSVKLIKHINLFEQRNILKI